MELEAYKAELIRELLNVNSHETLDKVKRVLSNWKERNTVASMPCCYTEQEIKQRLTQTSADALAGRGINEEEAEQMIEQMV